MLMPFISEAEERDYAAAKQILARIVEILRKIETTSL